MSPDILTEKKQIALAVEYAVDRTKGVSLVQKRLFGASYPYSPDVPGVWVHGPDENHRYAIEISIAVAGMKIHEAADRLRTEVYRELHTRDYGDRVKSVDIRVEDLMMAV